MSLSDTGSVGIDATLLDCSCCGWRVIGKPNRDSANVRSKWLSEVPLQCLQQDLGTIFFRHDCAKWGEPTPCCLWLPLQPFSLVLSTLPGFRYSENSSSLCWVHTKTEVFSTYYTWEECFSPFPGKGAGFSPFCSFPSFPVQNHIWAQRGGSAPEVLSGKQQTKPCLQLPLWLIQLCRYSCFQSTKMNFWQSVELKPLSIISPIGHPFQNESIIRL